VSVGDPVPCDGVRVRVHVGDHVRTEAEAVLPRDSEFVNVGDRVMV